jgi:hypothetical protein
MTNSFTPHGRHSAEESHTAPRRNTATTADPQKRTITRRTPFLAGAALRPSSLVAFFRLWHSWHFTRHPALNALRRLAPQQLDQQAQPLIHILCLQQLLAVLGLVDESRRDHVGQHFMVIDLF